MENIKDLTIYGYSITYNVNGFFRIFNGYGNHIASVFVKSGMVVVNDGCIFNYKQELQKAIKENPNFLNVL